MLDILFERSVTIGLVGAVIAVATFYAWVQTSHKLLFPLSIGIAATTGFLVAIGLMFDSDRETLSRFIYETAAELQANEHQKVIAKIHPQASIDLQEIRDILPRVRFTVARVKAIHEIQLKRHRTGYNASVTMNFSIAAEYDEDRGHAVRWVRLALEKVGDKWLIVDFEERVPHYDLLNRQDVDDPDAMPL